MPANPLFLLLITVAAGGLLPLQFALNARLASKVDSSAIWAALISVSVSTIFLFALAVATLDRWPRLTDMRDTSVWLWMGGVSGALFVASSTFVLPRIGAGLFVGALLFGQIIVSTFMDHYGLLGVPTDPATLRKILGIALVFCGLVLVRGF